MIGNKRSRVVFVIMMIVMMTLVALLVAQASAAPLAVGTITVGAQSGTLTYGTGGSATFLVTVTKSGGNFSNVSLTVSGLPAGATGTFAPNPVSCGGGCTSVTSTLGITTTAVTPAGTLTITVHNTDNGITGTGTLTVNKANQTISVTTPAPATAVYNTNFTVTATASSGLSVAYNAVGVCTNVGSIFTMTSGTGTCTVQYNQAGDANFSAAPPVTETVTAQKANTTASLASSANPSVLGASVTFTTTVVPSAATGTVQFYADGATLDGAVTLLGGVAGVSTASLLTGTHVITATYSGDSNFNANMSPPLVQTVSAVCLSITGADFSYLPTAPRVGQSVNFTATVTGGTAPITYTWNFGHDGNVVTTLATTVHSFPLTTTVQTYAVSLTAANACSTQAVAPKQVTVQPYGTYLPVILR